MKTSYAITILSLCALILSPSRLARSQVNLGNPLLKKPEHILAIGAATSGEQQGLYAVDASGTIYFHTSESPMRTTVAIDELIPKYSFPAPAGVGYADPNLYVYDVTTRQIWAVDLRSTENPVAQSYKTKFVLPSHMAISPSGLVAVIDGKQLFFLQEGHEAVVYPGSTFPEPAGLDFSSSGKLHVLDRSRRSLVTITLNRLASGEIRFLPEEASRAEPMDGFDWQAMAVYNGNVYLANEENVFVYLHSDKTRVSVLPDHARFTGISQIAVTANGLYLLHDNGLALTPRAEPISMALEGPAGTSQEALLEFYWYLLGLDMLPTRSVRARNNFARLEDFLFDSGTILAPTKDELEIRVYQDQEQMWVQSQSIDQQRLQELKEIPNESQSGTHSWSALICKLNPGLCDDSAFNRVQQGQTLIVPSVNISSRLSKERILLQNQPLTRYLDQLVFSNEFQDRKSPAFLLRLNPNLGAVGADEILTLRRGTVVVPVEKWLVTAAVPAIEYENDASALWELQRRFKGVSVYSRRLLTPKSAESMATSRLPGDDPSTDACATLQEEKDRWWKSIKYPVGKDGQLIAPTMLEREVRIAVLEKKESVQMNHQIFTLDPSHPAWYSAQDLEFNAPPEAASREDFGQPAIGTVSFSIEAHHGTHVAALIGGRQDKCWSGLLPKARLVLIDPTDVEGGFPRAVKDAVDAGVLVFNVSQVYSREQEVLHGTIRDARRAIWIAATGNDGKDLDGVDEAAVPAPARWGALPNLLSVTASDWQGNIINNIETERGTRKGANRGKRFDLVAPGENVISALEKNVYGRATGTSQAVPQVAAAAALLMDPAGDSMKLFPGDAKARLIATADWNSAYAGAIWGGKLNFAAATMYPERNLIRTKTDADLGQLHSLVLDGDRNIVIANAPHYYERVKEEGDLAPEKIRFSRILSLKRQKNGNFRVVFLDEQSHLKIILDAKLEDEDARPLQNLFIKKKQKIKCLRFEILNEAKGTFQEDDGCQKDGLSITQVDEYIMGGNYHVEWGNQ